MKEFEIQVISTDSKEQFILFLFIGKRFITLLKGESEYTLAKEFFSEKAYLAVLHSNFHKVLGVFR